MTSFTVDPTQLAGLPEVVASLPISLAPAGTTTPQLSAVAGTPGWTGRAAEAVLAGALGAVVDAPEEAPTDQMAGDVASRVVLAWEFASNPGVLAAAGAAAPLRRHAFLAEATLTVRSANEFKGALLDLLTTSSRVFGEFTSLVTLHKDATGWHLAGKLAGGAPLVLTLLVTTADPASLRLRLLTGDGGLAVVVPSSNTAAPAEVRIVGPDGERLLPTLWETSRRASWRRVVAIAAGDAVSDDLAEFRHTITVAPVSSSGTAPNQFKPSQMKDQS